MALSKEKRAIWHGYIGHWRNDWGKEFPSLAPPILAVDDHLKACEALLKEIGGNVGEDPNGGYYVKSLGGDVLIDQHKQITALLGSAATADGDSDASHQDRPPRFDPD